MMKRTMAGLVFMLVAVLTAVWPGEAINCGEVDIYIGPCLNYLHDGGAHPPMGCCDSFRNLLRSTPTQQDRQAACECLKATAASPNIKPDVAVSLPQNCGLISSITISTGINCQSIY